MRIVVINEDDLNDAGEKVQHDVTDAVGALYDLAVGSMDYGSGFWTADDAVPVAQLARLCGYKQVDELEAYIEQHQRWEEERKERSRQERIQREANARASKRPGWIFEPEDDDD